MDARSQLILSAVLDFSADELAANRAGQLSARQVVALRKSRSRSRVATGAVALTAAAFIAVVAITLLPRLSAGRHPGSSAEVPYVVGALILVALLMSQSVFRTGRSLNQMVSGTVSRAEGLARTRVRRLGGNIGDPQSGIPGRPGGSRCELTIGGTRFFVSPAVLAAFNDGQAYRGYYVGQGLRATLVSAESL
ncbi:MAG TPA: hypothetical protein VEM58_11450 [Streptosporangiaceae bacterium]|nr:hypothetical protein [Streptosporangiaceae bacterium]